MSPRHASQDNFLQRADLYHASNFPFFMSVKAGIGFVAESRIRNVSETTKGFVWVTAKIDNMEFAYWCEQFIHWLYWLQNKPFRTGSGRTEWFLNLNPIIGGAFTLYAWQTGTLGIWDWYFYWLAWSFPFLWLDFLLWMQIFRLLRFVFGLTVIFALIKLAIEYAAHVRLFVNNCFKFLFDTQGLPGATPGGFFHQKKLGVKFAQLYARTLYLSRHNWCDLSGLGNPD